MARDAWDDGHALTISVLAMPGHQLAREVVVVTKRSCFSLALLSADGPGLCSVTHSGQCRRLTARERHDGLVRQYRRHGGAIHRR
jgi:hypothetical protein